jgi:hypothetical protein
MGFVCRIQGSVPRYSLYLLYCYKSTNTDAALLPETISRRFSVYLLYWYKSTNTDAAHLHAPQYTGHGHVVFLGMLTYAHVCSRMLSYAHVCCRMLPYAVVC